MERDASDADRHPAAANPRAALDRNVALYPWFKFCHGLLFWQAVWFLYFQEKLSPAEAILLYVIYDLATTLLEAPSGYLSDRFGRRVTLLAAAIAGTAGAGALAFGDGFSVFALGQILLGASAALASGTESAFLFESLAKRGCAGETERMELRAWRAMFAALMLSAVTGGLMAQIDPRLPFIAGAAAFAASAAIALRFVEPAHSDAAGAALGEAARARMLLTALSGRATLWLIALGVAMYVFSHVPFVFGQPLILAAMDKAGLAPDAPSVSGVVTAAMMAIALAASLGAPAIRRRCGLVGVLLLAFGLQIGLCGALALADQGLGFALLVLRMIPDALSRPYLLAALQPLLPSAARATILSLKSLAGRLLFSASLLMASAATSNGPSPLATDELSLIFSAYAVAGAVWLLALFAATRRTAIDRN